jgi:hypothetical protein
MKKIIFSVASLICLAFSAMAQTSGAVITTIPSSFTAEDDVKIIVDVSAVGNLAGKEPLYMWTWNPGNPAPGNGDWGSSNEARKMTKEGPNKWSVTFKPTDFYGKAPAEITKIEFLVKAKDGNGDAKTNDIALTVDPLVYTPVVFRTFPKFVSKNDIISIYLDQTLATDVTTERMTPSTAEIAIFNGTAQLGTTQTVNIKNEGNKVWSYIFFPNSLFGLSASTTATKITVKYKGTIKDVNGNTIPAESIVFEKPLDDLK